VSKVDVLSVGVVLRMGGQMKENDGGREPKQGTL
jgi:hypothetical protein